MLNNVNTYSVLRKLLPENKIWTVAPFLWVYEAPEAERQEICEQLIAGWCASRELNVARSPDSEADKIIEGHRVEIKFSTLWANGSYKFQQIRDQSYDYLICLGISPFSAHAWILTKKVILKSIIHHPEHSQHRGRQGSDTYWLQVLPNKRHPLFATQPGRLSFVYSVLARSRAKRSG